MKQTLLFLILIIGLLFSCERKPEISFEKTLETAVQAISEKTDIYFVELAKPSNTTNIKVKYAKEIEMHIKFNQKLIQSITEIDSELSLKEKTLTYFDLTKEIIQKSKNLNDVNLIQKQQSTFQQLTKNIHQQFLIFCNKHDFEKGLSIYDIDKYQIDLKKVQE
jgi:hypothetical protein